MKGSKYISKEEYYITTRNGESVKVSDVHKEILVIMDEVDRICRKYHITYGLIAGSALGMVNYGGFIPWDDDIDIFVLDEDWDMFLEALDKELPKDIYYHCYDKDNQYNVLIPQMKIRKRNTYVEEENILLDNRCSGNGVFVDVVKYGDICPNKLVDEIFRSFVKIVMIPLVFIDNLGFNPILLKKLVVFISNKYAKISRGSKYVSQPISIPWEKFMREPVFLKEDVLPVQEYDFEGRKYFSYRHIEKVLKQWYGDNCLKRWNEKRGMYEETLPREKRICKHIRDVNLHGEVSVDERSKRKFNLFVRMSFWCFLFWIISLLIGEIMGIVLMFVLFIIIVGLALMCKK